MRIKKQRELYEMKAKIFPLDGHEAAFHRLLRIIYNLLNHRNIESTESLSIV